jgi:hypothetical protein
MGTAVSLLDIFRGDVVHGARVLLRSPACSLIGGFALALGIGAIAPSSPANTR